MVLHPTVALLMPRINSVWRTCCGVLIPSKKPPRVGPRISHARSSTYSRVGWQYAIQFLAGQLSQDELLRAHEEYTERLCALSFRPRANQANDQLANHLYNHTGEWFMFLVDPNIPATNHRGEQALRTPIVNRKVWGGNRSPPGVKAQEIDTSVIATCKKRARCAISFISQALCGSVGSLFTTASQR